MSDNMFNSEVELTKFLGSLNVIPHAFSAILDTTLPYELHTTPSGIKILAFNRLPDDYTTRFLDGEFDLVSSENHKQAVDFISTKVNSSFFINKAAVELFEHLSTDLKDLEKKHIYTPLVVTGSGLGGYRAILSALRLHQAIDVEESNGAKKTKRPICITFGSPLVGDVCLQGAISERPQWKSSFLNVVAIKDPVATFFTSLSTSYKPLGTTLFCTESGCHSAFQDQDEVLAVLDSLSSPNAAGNKQTYDYGNVLSSIRKKVLYRGVTKSGDFKSSFLKAGITLQLKAVGVLNDISNDLIKKTEERKTKLIKSKRNTCMPSMKLNQMKQSLIFLEWYMRISKPKGGYYDSYKNGESKEEITSKQEIIKHVGRLNHYWKKLVEEKNLMPQTEGAKLYTSWLLSGTTYRRIVEPLDIANYYKQGNRNYIENRQNHYKLLQKWADEDTKDTIERIKAASLTEDSCFWAHVEEALISLNELRNGGLTSNNVDEIEKKLERFEADVMLAINNFSMSTDIFIEGCSFMKWWSEYKAYKGSLYVSEFAQYMNSESYEWYIEEVNQMKISLTYMEWYMKSMKPQGGYYDSYKNAETTGTNTEWHQRSLNQYWKNLVEEKNSERAKLSTRWLLAGTTYRRIVEPLDIAEYYRNGNRNYIENRPDHYKLLQKWLVEHEKEVSPRVGKIDTSTLTKDSCFWAYVEEAVISLTESERGASSGSDIAQGMRVFEDNVRHALTVVRSRWINS